MAADTEIDFISQEIGRKVQHMVSLFIWMIPAQHIVTLVES
jgi:hypothetical protein